MAASRSGRWSPDNDMKAMDFLGSRGDEIMQNGRPGGKFVAQRDPLSDRELKFLGTARIKMNIHRVSPPPALSPTSAQMVQNAIVKEVSSISQSSEFGRPAISPSISYSIQHAGGRIPLSALITSGRQRVVASKRSTWIPSTSYQFGYEIPTTSKPRMSQLNDEWTPAWTPYTTGPASYCFAVSERVPISQEQPTGYLTSMAATADMPVAGFRPMTDYASARSRGFSAFGNGARGAATPPSQRRGRAAPTYNSKMGPLPVQVTGAWSLENERRLNEMRENSVLSR